MLFLVEMDHVKSGPPLTPETGRKFIEEVIFPTIALATQLLAEKRILAGGPVLGRVALRLMVEADSLEEVDQILTSLPIWPYAETRVTPLISFDQRRAHAQAVRERLASVLQDMSPTAQQRV
jgi:muconolactone delta-isomerase